MSEFNKMFWLVWCPSRGIPTKMHESTSSAIDEAKRLAEKHPFLPFYVMESQCTCIVPKQPVQKIEHIAEAMITEYAEIDPQY